MPYPAGHAMSSPGAYASLSSVAPDTSQPGASGAFAADESPPPPPPDDPPACAIGPPPGPPLDDDWQWHDVQDVEQWR